MDRATFTRHLVEASERARSFAGDYLLESLPPPIVCRVHLNASYDAGATPAERLYPEDSARGPFLCTRDALVDVLYRDGRVPEWIDLAVVGETGEATVLGVLSCGRFVEDDRFLYHVREGYPPFHVTSPTLPPGHVEGQRFSVYLRSACTTPEDVSRVRARREVVRFLELHDGCRPDEVLPALEPFPSMTVLEVHGARHADWLAALARHRKLVHLRVSLRGDASVALERLPTVRTLSLTAERELALSGTPPSTITTLTLDARRLRGVVKGVPKLDWLSISADELDVPEWMGACRRWPSLTALDLSRTPVGDEVVDDLLAMDSLQYVGLVGTRVSDAGFVRLRAARPALRTRARRVP